jgi:hypothetical protein
MQSTVKRLFRAPMAVLVMSTAIGIIGNSPAPAQEQPAIASRVPTKTMADPKGLPSPVLVDSVTPGLSMPMPQTRQEIFGRLILSPGNFTPAAEEDACRIIVATLLSKNGPNGGWCWLVTTDCGDQYQKGDCWYTESVSENRNSSH